MVATVHELASTATAVSYYEKDGYYAKNDPEHRKASFWHGTAAEGLNLRGHVVPSRFESVLSGKVPKSGIRLGRIVEGARQHRPGWDITFSAPKSVSLEALVMGDARVVRAHDEAVRATLDWIERDLLQTRGWDPATKRRPRVKAHGMVVAGFRHLTSRDLDPQLHTHCVLANMTRSAEGAWKSIEPTLIRRSERLIGAHYRNELAARLEALGLAVTPTMVGPVPGFELAGYDKAFLDAFSGRRREILAYLAKHGLPATREATQKATLHTRRRKVEAGLAELVPQWRSRARALGLTRDGTALNPPRPIDPETGRETPPPGVPGSALSKNERRRRRRSPAVPHLAPLEAAPPEERQRPLTPTELVPEPETGCLEAVARAVAHFEERRTVIPERDIRTLALGHAPGRYRLEEIDRAIERLVADGELVETVQRGSDRSFVTDRAVKAERRILKMVKEGRAMTGGFAEPETVAARLAEASLTQGQADAVRHIVGEGDRTIGVQGRAGTGKTTMLTQVAGLVGREFLTGLAPSTAAARVLAKETGIPTRTLQWFLVRYGDLSDPVRLERAREDLAGTVLAIDEASMIGTVQMERLLAIADTVGIARVVLVGDTAQLKAVNAGQPFALMQKAGMATAVMDEVLRQKDPELKEAVAHAREGEAGAAVSRLANRVIEHTREELGAQAAEAWLALPPDERDDCAVLAPTHAIRRKINDKIREGLAEEGRLSGRTLVIERLIDRRYTRVEAAEIGNYEPGDTVVFHRDAYGCLADDTCTVTRIEEGRVVLDHADGEERSFRPSGNAARNLGVHETAQIEIRAGDRIRWTRNRRVRRGKPECVNGEEMCVLSIGPRRVRMMAADGTEVSFSRADPQLRHLDHAWSSTVHAAQGRTAPKVIAVLDAGGMANQEMFYVEVSRASHGFTLLTDDREALVDRLETSPDVPDVALEALGEDFDAPVVDSDAWADAVAGLEAVRREAQSSECQPSSVPGYAETMAQVAAFGAIEDLPDEMRAFVDRCLAAHDSARTVERQVRDLIADLQAQPRRWPEVLWAARRGAGPADENPGWLAWRDESAALVEAARQRLAKAHDGSPDLDSENRRRLETALARLEDVRVKDDAVRFDCDWRALQMSSESEAVPVSLLAGYEALAGRGAVLQQATALTADERRAVDEWQARHAIETALIQDIQSVPERTGALMERLAHDVPLDGAGGVDPENPGLSAWHRDAEGHLRRLRSLLAPDSPHAAHVAAMPGARDEIEAAAGAIAKSLRAHHRATLLWQVHRLANEAHATGRLPLDMPEWPDVLRQVRDAVDSAAPGDPATPRLTRWLDDDGRWLSHRNRVRGLVDRLEDLRARRPRHDGNVDEAVTTSPDRKAWIREAVDFSRALGTAMDSMTERERAAHMRASGTTPDEVRRFADTIPAWQQADAALDRLAGWHSRVSQALTHGDAAAAGVLIQEGKSLQLDAAVPFLGDTSGARTMIAEATGKLDAILLNDACTTLARLAGSVDREAEARGIHPLDAADYPRLVEALTTLAGREGVPKPTRGLVARWKDAGRRWTAERRQVSRLLAQARRLETETARADPAGGLTPLSDSWRRDAAALMADARAMPGQERDAHVRSLGGDAGAFATFLDAIPGWLKADDAVREGASRQAHLLRLNVAVNEVLEQPVSGTIPWSGNESLLKGDRLNWVDDEGRHDMIVDDAACPDASGRIVSLVLCPVEAARAGRPGFIMPSSVAALARNPSCGRAAWVDESLRAREIERQFPATDATFSLPCTSPVVVGDRIRWTMTRSGDELRARLDGDTPQIEAIVEGFSPHAVFGADKLVELRVIRSWGRGHPPQPGESIDQRLSDLFRRGCVREPWEDEGLRAQMVADVEKEIRRWGRTRGLSM